MTQVTVAGIVLTVGQSIDTTDDFGRAIRATIEEFKNPAEGFGPWMKVKEVLKGELLWKSCTAHAAKNQNY